MILHAEIQYRLAKFPTKLPDCLLGEDQMRMQYSLSKPQTDQEPLQTELSSYKAWLSDDINTDRGKGPPAADSTTQNLMKALLGFLGFLYYFIKPNKLSLWNVLDGHSVAKYISYHKHKGNTIGTLSSQIACLRKALKYLSSQSKQQSVQQHIEAEVNWLSILNSQLCHIMPKEISTIQLPEAKDVVKFIERLKWKALHAYMGIAPGSVISMKLARLFHDALLACMIFGYLPPLRLVCLRTLQQPCAKGCLHKGCKSKKCTGNRLHILQNGNLQLHLSHFKVERK